MLAEDIQVRKLAIDFVNAMFAGLPPLTLDATFKDAATLNSFNVRWGWVHYVSNLLAASLKDHANWTAAQDSPPAKPTPPTGGPATPTPTALPPAAAQVAAALSSLAGG